MRPKAVSPPPSGWYPEKMSFSISEMPQWERGGTWCRAGSLAHWGWIDDLAERVEAMRDLSVEIERVATEAGSPPEAETFPEALVYKGPYMRSEEIVRCGRRFAGRLSEGGRCCC